MKRSNCLLISAIAGSLYSCLITWYCISTAAQIESTAYGLGTAIGMGLIMPHVLCTLIAVIFNWVGFGTNKRWAALTGAILYSVAAVLMPLYTMFVVLELTLSFIGFAKLKTGETKIAYQFASKENLEEIKSDNAKTISTTSDFIKSDERVPRNEFHFPYWAIIALAIVGMIFVGKFLGLEIKKSAQVMLVLGVLAYLWSGFYSIKNDIPCKSFFISSGACLLLVISTFLNIPSSSKIAIPDSEEILSSTMDKKTITENEAQEQNDAPIEKDDSTEIIATTPIKNTPTEQSSSSQVISARTQESDDGQAVSEEISPALTKKAESDGSSNSNEITIGQKNALRSAKSYLELTAFSYKSLIKQLEYEKFSTEDAAYAADNCGADWNEQAAKSAKSYLELTSFSRDSLIKQLEYEGFTHEQAVYGAQAAGY